MALPYVFSGWNSQGDEEDGVSAVRMWVPLHQDPEVLRFEEHGPSVWSRRSGEEQLRHIYWLDPGNHKF